ncbi:hypothetical protein [Paraburkholderia sp. J41]|uniref:hypothetical protein n=1 Tax=Paraburkholderia sp. J41 TaxID=2805433 RepID=UPI002AC36231|nr:hypothetical protein [Paraburkholderia sp. J41]
MTDVLAFDWGTTMVGVLDVQTGIYTPYRGVEKSIEGATRILSAEGVIVSFNGTACDLPKLFELLKLDQSEQVIGATHDDMLLITSNARWPSDAGTGSIKGPGLIATYKYYLGSNVPVAPEGLTDEYEVSNWRDCHMTAALWKKWKRGELAE